MKIKDYYKLLGVEPTSDLYDIKKAFRNEIAKYHPDINTSKNAEKHFDSLVEAFDILSKPDKRKLYDSLLNESNINHSKPIKVDKKQEATLKEWKKEAKEKSETYKKKNQNESISLDLFSQVVIEGLLEGAANIVEGTVEILGDILDGI